MRCKLCEHSGIFDDEEGYRMLSLVNIKLKAPKAGGMQIEQLSTSCSP